MKDKKQNGTLTIEISLTNYDEIIKKLETIKKLLQEISNINIQINKKEQSNCESDCPLKKPINYDVLVEEILEEISKLSKSH